MKTEREFNIALRNIMRRARNHNKCKNPIYFAKQMNIPSMSVYMSYECGHIPISAYQLYQFIQITNMSPDKILDIFTGK